MKTYIVTFQVIYGYTVTVAADDEEQARQQALAAYDERKPSPDYVDFDYFDFCINEAQP